MEELGVLFAALKIMRDQRDAALIAGTDSCHRGDVLKTYNADVLLLIELWRESRTPYMHYTTTNTQT